MLKMALNTFWWVAENIWKLILSDPPQHMENSICFLHLLFESFPLVAVVIRMCLYLLFFLITVYLLSVTHWETSMKYLLLNPSSSCWWLVKTQDWTCQSDTTSNTRKWVDGLLLALASINKPQHCYFSYNKLMKIKFQFSIFSHNIKYLK